MKEFVVLVLAIMINRVVALVPTTSSILQQCEMTFWLLLTGVVPVPEPS